MLFMLKNAALSVSGVENLDFAAIKYRAIRHRIQADDPQIDQQTLADTLEGA
jgi:hypothetical protein